MASTGQSVTPDAARQLHDAYAAHAGVCRRYASQLDAHGAEDAAQEAFVKLARRLARGDALPEHPRAWLLAATRSAALDARRSRSRRQRRETAFAPPADEPEAVEAEPLLAALRTLPARQREVVVLRLWAGLTFPEAAELIGVAASTAHADYTAAIETMRQILTKDAR